MNDVDRCTGNEDFHSISHALLFRLAIRNVSGNGVDLKVKSLLAGSGINDIHHSVAAMYSRQQITKESSRKDIVHGGETMSAKKNPALHKPRIECHVPFQLSKGKSSADLDVKANDITTVFTLLGHLLMGTLIPSTYLDKLSPEGMSLSMVMQPREEAGSIGRILFWSLMILRACKKSRINGLIR